MKEHAFNLFPVANQDELSISYRLVDVEGELGLGSEEPDLASKNLNLLVKRLAFGQKLPVAIVRGGAKPILAVAADRIVNEKSYQLTPHVANLSPRDETETIPFRELDSSSLPIALSFLGWELRGHLYQHGKLWRSGTNSFYQKEPVQCGRRKRSIDTYGGFSPRFVFIDGQLHLSVPVIYCYTDSNWADLAFGERELRRLGGKRMLYHYGNRQFPIKFQRRTGKSIAEQQFCPPDGKGITNVFDWTVQAAGKTPGGRNLDPNSPAIQYRNTGDDERYGALSLCKLMLNNEDPRVASSRRDHQRTPSDRINAASGIVRKFLRGLSFSGMTVQISDSPRKRRGKQFKIPAVSFGNGNYLEVRDGQGGGNVNLRDLGKQRVRLLENGQVGIAVPSELDDQILVVPRSMPRDVVEDMADRLQNIVSTAIRTPYKFRTVTYEDDRKQTLRSQVDTIIDSLDENEVNGARGILVLPRAARSDLHNYIKKRLRERAQFQCMAAGAIARFYGGQGKNGSRRHSVAPHLRRKFHSYLQNTMMGLLIVNRQWPWVLRRPTNYDAYIGMDVLDHTSAFTFFYDGGRVCAMRDRTSSNKEKLPRNVVAKVVYDGILEDLPDLDGPPSSLILRRDGMLFRSEWLGFQDAVRKLISEEELPADIQLGATETPKHHSFGIRLVEVAGEGYRNPTIGCWEKISEIEGLVCTTGFPFNIPGTSEPLVVRVAEGELDLVKVLEDTLAMSQLCWPAPGACMRLTIDLKLCDEQLRAYSGRTDDDSVIFGDPSETETDGVFAPATHAGLPT